MLRRLAVTTSVVSVLALLGACGADEGTATGILDAPLGASAPFILVPTAANVFGACAAELATTYCSEAAATAAANHCHARLPECAGADCTVTYAAERASCAPGPTYPTAAACDHPQADDCSFYRSCLESSHACGDDGYALAYGERLCYAFIEKRETFSSDGQRWLRGIRSCLQRSLVPLLHEPATCASLLDRAYATHPDCYTAPDNSICSLPTGDILELVSVLGNDLLSSRAQAQIRDVAHTCVLEFFGFRPAREWHASRHEFFTALEAAASSEDALRAFVAKSRAE